MRFFVVQPQELGRPELARWQELQEGNPLLASPCFSHHFTLAAAAARQDARVAVLEEGHRIVGFFPHHQRWGAGEPIGGRLSDHHGVVCDAGLRWDWKHLLQACGLAYWHFDHLPAWQAPPTEVLAERSPGLDLSGGYEAWWARRTAATSALASLPRKLRKLQREVGPVRFELHSADPHVFATVLRLKSEQCRRTRQLDFFAWDWTRRLVACVRDTDAPSFGGRLSALYAGDTLVAAHFGMRSAHVWHWWFPVYSTAHAAYSPGSLLLLKLAEAVAAEGHRLLDLGRGEEAYKSSFADCAQPLVEGLISRPALLTYARALRKSVGRWLRGSPLTPPRRPLVVGTSIRPAARNG